MTVSSFWPGLFLSFFLWRGRWGLTPFIKSSPIVSYKTPTTGGRIVSETCFICKMPPVKGSLVQEDMKPVIVPHQKDQV